MCREDVIQYIISRYRRPFAHKGTKIVDMSKIQRFILMCEIERKFRIKFSNRDELWKLKMDGITIGELADLAMKADKQGVTTKKYYN